MQSILGDFEAFQGIQKSINDLVEVQKGIGKRITEKQKVLSVRCDDPLLFYETLVQSDPSVSLSYDKHSFFATVFNWDDRYNLRTTQQFDVFIQDIRYRMYSGPQYTFRLPTPDPLETIKIPGELDENVADFDEDIELVEAEAPVGQAFSPVCPSSESTAPSSPGARSTSLEEKSSSSSEASSSVDWSSSVNDSSFHGSSSGSSDSDSSDSSLGKSFYSFLDPLLLTP